MLKQSKNRLITTASVFLLIVLWKLLSLFYANELIIPPPESTILATIDLLVSKNFISIVGLTIIRGLAGFLFSFILGLGLGILAGVNSSFHAFLKPILVTLRSTPVISFILLALIWFNVDRVPVFIAFLTMFPFICTNVIDGIRDVDRDLVEMARIYQVSHAKIIKEVYLPAIIPFVFSGSSSAMGFGWRAIIIGEVLSQPQYGIGTAMQTAQTYLLVKEVIAWTIIAIIISYLFEIILRRVERKIVDWK
ncbi:MAG: ABC transporter permease subunit [Bacteroidales bacterium]|jgi:NitT/TauT family transport system permease protein|nr:ABC transporter permease subunit [Bacteroidales bacterium]